jgi:hypothetical protein
VKDAELSSLLHGMPAVKELFKLMRTISDSEEELSGDPVGGGPDCLRSLRKCRRAKKLRHPERRLSAAQQRAGVEGPGWPDAKEMHPTASCRREKTVGRLGTKRAKSVSIIPGKTHEVLRLRSGRRVERSKAFRLAPLRMTDWKSETFVEVSSSPGHPKIKAPNRGTAAGWPGFP